jgi:predicted CoA-substrate-specific enzyme activase
MTLHAMGVDFGSMTAKAVIVDGEGRVLASSVVDKGVMNDEGADQAMADVLTQTGLSIGDIASTVSTGYGRRKLEVAQRTITEITCHARGAHALFPDARMVIDIGGQDSKVIAVDDMGHVQQFAMNDRCAAGTGQFMQVLARALKVPLEEMGPLSLTGAEDLTISAMCTTFAETEVISLRAQGHSNEDILHAVMDSITKRTMGLIQRVGKRSPVAMTGGVAKNIGVVRALEKRLGGPLLISGDPQIAGALGAALFALDDARRGVAVEPQMPGFRGEADRMVEPGGKGGCGRALLPELQKIRDTH